jgi:ribosomal protein S16
MSQTQTAQRDERFIELLLAFSPVVEAYQSSAPLMEQLIDNILSDGEDFCDTTIRSFKQSILDEFVDWNEVRLVAPDRLMPFFSTLNNGEYKRKALQAILNKIFSRSGSLDYQFMMDFESDDLEDYLAGIMELREGTRKRLMLRVFRKSVNPVTTDHEVIFEKAATDHMPGSEEFKALFSKMPTLELERIHRLLDRIVHEHGGVVAGELLSPEDFHSEILSKILVELENVA